LVYVNFIDSRLIFERVSSDTGFNFFRVFAYRDCSYFGMSHALPKRDESERNMKKMMLLMMAVTLGMTSIPSAQAAGPADVLCPMLGAVAGAFGFVIPKQPYDAQEYYPINKDGSIHPFSTSAPERYSNGYGLSSYDAKTKFEEFTPKELESILGKEKFQALEKYYADGTKEGLAWAVPLLVGSTAACLELHKKFSAQAVNSGSVVSAKTSNVSKSLADSSQVQGTPVSSVPK
jgi:hypothetical protein